MRGYRGKGPVVKSETGAPTEEHRKASRAGQIASIVALAFLIIAGAAFVTGFVAVASTAAGICVALIVVGLLLHYEGERQYQRPDPARPRSGK